MSTASYENHKLYSVRGGNSSPGLSSQLYGSDKHNTMYLTESFGGLSYDSKFFINSPSEEVIHPSSSASLFDSYQTYNELEYSVTQSPDANEYDEDKMRLKLQELEHALLDDDEEDEDETVIAHEPTMELDDEEWALPLRDMMLHDSPKESTSSDSSNFSSISCGKEVTLSASHSPKELLFSCAAMISEGNLDDAASMIGELRKMVSIQGDPSQRIAAYMVEGLAARLASSGKVLYKALKCKEPPALDRLAAMQILFEVCPCFKFGFMAANEAIIGATKNEKRVHIIDFDISQGNQYINLIQALARQYGKSIHLRLTGVDDPESVQRPVGGLKNIGERLEALAEMVGLSFEFKAIPANTPLIKPEMLECQEGDALVVNFAFQLHHMPDESVSTINQRDQLLQMVKSLKPKLVTVVEQDVNTNTTPFLSRFAEAYSYYSAVFESLDSTLPRESQDRVNVEKQCLARDIVNIVACEGVDRIERYEVAGKWRARMLMAGFTSLPMKENVSNMIQKLILAQYCSRYKLKEVEGALHFGWEDKSLIVASTWA